MSVLPQELLRKISAHSDSLSKHSSSRDVSRARFRELLKVQATDEKPKERKLPSASSDEEKDEEETGSLPSIFAPPCPQGSSSDTAPSAPAIPSLNRIAGPVLPNPAMEAAFEKMASTMILMNSAGDRETTLFLDGAHFSGSCLFGTQITIREFSTAPKAFNIEVLSNSLGAAAIDAGKNALLLSFQNGNFNFTVHRFDTHIQQSEERPVLHRKESHDRDPQDQKRGREQYD